jgi:hypothetical protein
VSELALDADTAVVGGDVIAYRALRFGDGGGNLLVVRDRTTLDELWTAPIEPFGIGQFGEIVVSQGNIHLLDSVSEVPVIKVFPLAGCGAASCSPTATFSVPAPTPPLATTGAQLLAATDEGDLLVERSAQDDGGAAEGGLATALICRQATS